MESIAAMKKLQMTAFIFQTQMPLIALQIFFEGSATTVCKSDRGLGIMLLEISGTFLSLIKAAGQKRTPLVSSADCAYSRSAFKESGPSLDSWNADRTLQRHSFVFSELASAGKKFAEVYSQRIR